MFLASYNNRYVPTTRRQQTRRRPIGPTPRRILLRHAPILLVAAYFLFVGTQVGYSAPFRQWATSLTQRINREFGLPSHLYAETRTPHKHGHLAYAWPSNIELRVLTAATVVAPRTYYEQMMDFAAALTHRYLVKSNGVWGFNASARGHRNRLYDDNGGMLLALMEIYSINRSPAILSTAKKVMAFLLSGENKVQGGGIYQSENARVKKVTTATIQAAMGGLLLYKATHQKKYLDDAHRLYHWLTHTLKAPNGLFYTSINARTGKIAKYEMSHNAAYPIITELLFYDISGKRSDLNSAIQMAKVAEKKWIGKSGQLHRPGRWAFKLADAFIELYERTGNAHWLKVVERAMIFVHQHARDARGHYGKGWGVHHMKTLHKWSLIDQACVARVYWRLAACQSPYYRKKIGLLTLGCRRANHNSTTP